MKADSPCIPDVYTGSEVRERLNVTDKRFREWLRGRDETRGRQRVIHPLRHFRDGDSVVILHGWLIEFLTVNAIQFGGYDDEGEGDSES